MIGVESDDVIQASQQAGVPTTSTQICSTASKARFPLGLFKRTKSQRQQLLVEEKLNLDSKLIELKDEITKKKEDIEKANKDIHALEEKLCRKRRRAEDLAANIDSIENELPSKVPRTTRVKSCTRKDSTDKLNLSNAQALRRRKKTLAALRPLHCANTTDTTDVKPIYDGLWTTLVGAAPKEDIKKLMSESNICKEYVIPNIVQDKVKTYESSTANQVRTIRVLYEGGIMSKRKYTSIRNCTDIVYEDGIARKNEKTQFMTGCQIPKIINYQSLMKIINGINIGEVIDFETFATNLGVPDFPGVYRPLKPFLLELADLYLFIHEKKPCLHWFNNEEMVFYVACGADGAPFGRDETATAYLVSFLNLLHPIQSCNDNHLLAGANCTEDCEMIIRYTDHLRQEMEELENTPCTTEKGNEVTFKFKLFPSDMKWISTMSGELNNAATFFSSFANVNKDNKANVNGSIGDKTATWQEWDYTKRLEVVKEVEKYKSTLNDPGGRDRSKVTAFIASKKSRQEFVPPLGKYIDFIKAEPLHCTNNAWQHWFMLVFKVAMQFTDKNQLKSAKTVHDLPNDSPMMKLITSVRGSLKCGRLAKAIERWFNEKRTAKVEFSYRFTGHESKNFAWNSVYLIQILLSITTLPNSIVLKLHVLAYVAINLRNAASLYTRIEITKEEIDQLKIFCHNYFTALKLLLGQVNPTNWTVGYVIPHHAAQLYNMFGYGLGLNSMQGREAKHIKLKQYIDNTCKGRKKLQWWTVFRHEYVSIVWLRCMDPFSVSYKRKKEEDSYIPKRAVENKNYCYCGLPKRNEESETCEICSSDTMKAVEKVVMDRKVSPELRAFANAIANAKL